MAARRRRTAADVGGGLSWADLIEAVEETIQRDAQRTRRLFALLDDLRAHQQRGDPAPLQRAPRRRRRAAAADGAADAD